MRMQTTKAGQSSDFYSKFHDYLSKQADILNNTIADAKPNSKDVFVQTSTFNNASELKDMVHSSSTFARSGESLSYKLEQENMVGYSLGERRISYSPDQNGTIHVTDFDGENLIQTQIKA